MLTPFHELPESARVWIYQSNREFTAEEIPEITRQVENFIAEWTAHGSALQAGFELPYNRFLVIGLDEGSAAASGCSIDSSVRFIQGLQEQYQVDLLDKMNVTFKQGDRMQFKPLKDFRKMAKERAVNQNTVVFNNLVNTKYEYDNFWEVPAKESWHGRFMK